MLTDNSQIQVVLDMQTGALLTNFAKEQARSISATAADLIREALELHEDISLSEFADKRLKDNKNWISHDKAWA